jgi:membrane protein DedA with SNARE-associated domain
MNESLGIVDDVLNLDGWIAYTVVGLLVFGEAALFIGFVLPGETAVVLGGVLASEGHISLSLLCVVVVVGAIVGDTVGYEVGRHYGSRLLNLRIFNGRRRGLERAQQTLRERGGIAVFLGRFTAFFRAVMPGLAGTARMPYRRFQMWNAAGGIFWGVGCAVLGFLAGASYKKVEAAAGKVGIAVFAVFVAAVIVALVIRHRRERAELDETLPEPKSDSGS